MKVNICMFQKLLILSVKSGKFVERIYYSKPLSISVTGSKTPGNLTKVVRWMVG